MMNRNTAKIVAARICVLAFALLVGLRPVQAQPGETAQAADASPHSDAALLSEVRHIQPGTPFTVALRIEMEEGWHSYWKNPGDAGQPTSIEWALPEGFTAGSIRWPHPHRIDTGPLTSYGYSDQVLLLVTITPPEDLDAGTRVTLDGTANWLICADICLPASGELALSLPVRDAPPQRQARWQDAFDRARAKLPDAPGGWTVRAARSQDSYAMKVVPPEENTYSRGEIYFFPAEKGVLAHAAPQVVSHEGRGFFLALQQSDYAQEPADSLRGVLVISERSLETASESARALAIAVPVEEASAAGLTAGGGGTSMTLFWALLFAFAGGLLLNLMPCVFPVLSVKIMSFAKQAGTDGAKTRRHGLAFGAGVLVAFWVLAAALLVLRAAGHQIGWGFQLQSPLVVAFLVMLFFCIGLNLAGVFEFGISLMRLGGRGQEGPARSTYGSSFLSGVLATVVATPCTAPFMGAALGFALTLSVVEALIIFSALGVGMAVPYVALSMAPRLLDRLPRPGAWMETLRQALAFPMFGTAVWLAWVFGQQTGTGGMTLLLFALLLLGVAVWILGRWRAGAISMRQRLWTRTLATLALAGALALVLAGAGRTPAPGTTQTAEARWQPFSPEKVTHLRAQGRPVFVDFTAAWCLTCQVNERTALNAPAVQQAFKEKNVALLKADWTSRDPEITRALTSHGRSGVPLYVLYDGSGSEPALLPAILTEGIVLDALEALPAPEAAPVQAALQTAPL